MDYLSKLKNMKKNLTLALLMLFTVVSFAQESDLRKNRFEGNIGYSHYFLNDYSGSSEGAINSSVSYERILGDNGKLGIQGGIDMHIFIEDTDLTLLAFGAKLNWYIMGEGKGIYVGPGFVVGALMDSYYEESESYTSFGLNAGYQIQINKLFGIRVGLGYDLVQIGGSDIGDVTAFKTGVGFNFSI